MTGRQFRLDWLARTDRGSVRDHNEDTFAAVPEMRVWLVADGMGGHEAGDWASRQIAEAFAELPDSESLQALLTASAEAIHRANASIFARATEQGCQIGSTVVALAVADGQFGVLWAGDSRAYLLRADQLYQLTRDHTQVQAMVDRGILAPEDAASHPMSHVLAKAVGVEAELELEGFTDEVEPGDIFLLCSDGLHGVLDDAEILRILREERFHDAADRLIERCLEIGAKDNVTVILVQAHEPTKLIFAPVAAPIEGGDA